MTIQLWRIKKLKNLNSSMVIASSRYMRSITGSSCLFILVALFLFSLSAEATGLRQMTLTEAINQALNYNLQIQQAQAKVGESEAIRLSARGKFGPSIELETNLFRWDDEVRFSFSSPSPEVQQKHGPVLEKYSDLMGVLPDLFQLGAIREKTTSQTTITAAQPLTPLYTIAKAHRIAALGQEAARFDLISTQEDIIFEVTKSYIGLKQANSAVEISQTAVDQVGAHLNQTKAFLRAGLIGQNEVLKAELALVEAKQRLIQAQTVKALTQSNLAILLGLPPAELIEPVEEFRNPPPFSGPNVEQYARQAMEQRTDLQAMEKRVAMAKNGKNIAQWEFVPQVAAVASYQHSEGMGTLTPKDCVFAGGVLNWKIWEWGATYYNVRAADYKLKQARLGERQLRDGIYLEVKKSLLDLQAADQTLEVSRMSVTQAEENFRIEKAKFDKNTNTTTDVLDAQLALTRAKLNHSNALHQWYIAQSALIKASGGGKANLNKYQRAGGK